VSGRRPRERGLFDPPAAAGAQPASAPGSPPEQAPGPRVFGVSELTAVIAGRLGDIGRVRVEGELSGLKRASSGHLYFDLKDGDPKGGGARISCAIWRSQMGRALDFDPAEGDQVVATGKLDVYAPRGSYSLLVERLERSGLGALLARLEELKRDLAARGWFERKRPLPAWPRRIGLVTSRDGAALRDFLRTRSLRWPGYPLRLAHAPVQGPGAAQALADALTRLAHSGVDLIVLCRGGGSLEDLWSFNEEVLARAIHACPVPVVSGVGHETDTTLIDLVADHRAHTPTDAATRVVPDRGQLVERMERLRGYLDAALERQLERRAEHLARLGRSPRLAGAHWIVQERARQVGHLSARLASLGERRWSAPRWPWGGSSGAWPRPVRGRASRAGASASGPSARASARGGAHSRGHRAAPGPTCCDPGGHLAPGRAGARLCARHRRRRSAGARRRSAHSG
jgi:exodeoxyribonuclease VII large subunit